MRISVIIPSRLQAHRDEQTGELWLDRALRSVAGQSIGSTVEVEVVVGLDPGATLPGRFATVRAAQARSASQAHAVNAAVAASTGEVLALLEDDDAWEPKRLAYGLALLGQYDVVTSNQREIAEDGSFVRINDFPTPSGWLLSRALWDRLGPFEETFRFHVDTEYLGRMTRFGVRRLHLVEVDAKDSPWLRNVARCSAIARTSEASPLVIRTANTQGGMARIASCQSAYQQSQAEHQQMLNIYGGIPW